jgi:hypothetical protein
MAQRRVTDQALPDGVYPYTVASGQARYYAKLASGATKRGFTSARAASRFKKSADSAPAQPKQTRDSFAALWPGFLRVRRPYLVPGTYDDYARHGKLRLIPRFGPDKVAAITKADVQDWLADLDGGRGARAQDDQQRPARAAGVLYLAGRRSRAAAAQPGAEGRAAPRGPLRARLAAPRGDPGVPRGVLDRVPAAGRTLDRRRPADQRGARGRSGRY